MKRISKRIISFTLVLILLFSIPLTCFAATGYDRGYAGGMNGDGVIYAHGLDISEWQAGNIDFNAVKNAGYSYVILRAGTTRRKDNNFEEFYSQAKAAGLNVGAYFYSYATTPEQSTADAHTMLSWLSGKLFEYPIYFDYEDPSQEGLSTAVAQAICLNFMDTIAGAGYLTGMYTGSYKSTTLPMNTICSRYEFWVAHYKDYTYQTMNSKYCTTSGMYQYTDRNYVNGKGPYDANVCYKDYPSIVKRYGFNGYKTGTSPFGSFDNAEGGVGSFTVAGWALDNDDNVKSLDLYVSIGGPVFTQGAEGFTIKTEVYREDVNNTHGCFGYHGFHKTLGTKLTGWQEVYIYAYDNDGNADNVCIGNKTVYITPDTEPPVLGDVVVFGTDTEKMTLACAVSDNGYVSKVCFPTWTEENPDNKIWYEGWVFDGVAYCDVKIADFNNYNGKYYTHVYAYDSAGNYTGNPSFSTTFNNPLGSFDEISESDGTINIRGWAVDKDAIDESLEIHAYVGDPTSADTELHKNIIADKVREDVAQAVGCGENHGFDAEFKTGKSGTQDVYVYAINKGNGGNIFLGKKSVNISQDSSAPEIKGASIVSSDAQSFTVACDVADDRRVTEVNMCVWPEGKQDEMSKWYKSTIEDDVATATIPIADFGNLNGKYIIHIYAKDGHNNEVGYAYETTFNMPLGSFDAAQGKKGSVYVKGWAIDADALEDALYVDVYIGAPAGDENAEGHRIKADAVRSDVDVFFGLENNHGFETTIRTMKRGTQDIYLYAINIGNGDNVFVGSKTVTIDNVLYGDADANGEVTIADVTRVQQIVAGIVVETEFNIAADVDGNGKIDVRDATLIQRYLAKYIDKFPAES